MTKLESTLKRIVDMKDKIKGLIEYLKEEVGSKGSPQLVYLALSKNYIKYLIETRKKIYFGEIKDKERIDKIANYISTIFSLPKSYKGVLVIEIRNRIPTIALLYNERKGIKGFINYHPVNNNESR